MKTHLTRGIAPFFILLILLGVMAVGGGGAYIVNQINEDKNEEISEGKVPLVETDSKDVTSPEVADNDVASTSKSPSTPSVETKTSQPVAKEVTPVTPLKSEANGNTVTAITSPLTGTPIKLANVKEAIDQGIEAECRHPSGPERHIVSIGASGYRHDVFEMTNPPTHERSFILTSGDMYYEWYPKTSALNRALAVDETYARGLLDPRYRYSYLSSMTCVKKDIPESYLVPPTSAKDMLFSTNYARTLQEGILLNKSVKCISDPDTGIAERATYVANGDYKIEITYSSSDRPVLHQLGIKDQQKYWTWEILDGAPAGLNNKVSSTKTWPPTTSYIMGYCKEQAIPGSVFQPNPAVSYTDRGTFGQ